MNKARAVIDTNIWISGVFWGGKPGKIVDLTLAKKLTSCFSITTFAEWEEKIKPLAKKAKSPELYLYPRKYLLRYAVFVQPRQKVDVCRDPDDNHFLEVATEANAEFLITGDADLLDLKKFEGVQIVTPSKFLALC